MLNGLSVIGLEKAGEQPEKLYAFSTVTGRQLPEAFSVATLEEIEWAIGKAGKAFSQYSALPPYERAAFLEAIAEEILALGEVLVARANMETGLPLGRLNGERDRTVNQLKLFASVLREGSWAGAVIDTAIPDRKPLPRADLRRMQVAIGPVAVFAASNFPFAFSTAGGDTASALASGCPVIVKAHGSHLGTNELVSGAVQRAAARTGMPDGVFSSLVGEGAMLGQYLAKHPGIKAIGFTGSFRAGMALFRTANNERSAPIPVYAEMSSINPVLLLPGKIASGPALLAQQLAASISLGVGQFCTNPGLLFVLEDENTALFADELGKALAAVPGATMLNRTICKSFYFNKEKVKAISGVRVLTEGANASDEYLGTPALLQVSAANFMREPELQEEIFGPASLLVTCADAAEMLGAIECIHGQLTGSVFGDAVDLAGFGSHVQALINRVGRIIFNQVPTGVEVCHAMVHGGPFPATTDARSTSVGSDAIFRFLRPVCWQDCPAELLPPALQNSNPYNLMRKVNGVFSRDAID